MHDTDDENGSGELFAELGLNAGRALTRATLGDRR